MLTVETKKFSKIVDTVCKGASCNKMIPITNMIAISVEKDGKLSVVATDGNTYFGKTEMLGVEGEPFYVVVNVEPFKTLVAKTSSANITLNLSESCLEFVGNGKYKIDLPLDENGLPVRYPAPYDVAEFTSEEEVTNADIKMIADATRKSVAKNDSVLCYTGALVGERTLATDIYKLTCVDTPVLADAKILPISVLDLITTLSEKIKVQANDDCLMFSDDTGFVFTKPLDKTDFDENALSEWLNNDGDATCKIAKDELSKVVDRVALFISPYEENMLTLTFAKDKLFVKSKSGSGEEILPYLDGEKEETAEMSIGANSLKEVLDVVSADSVSITYNAEGAIIIKDGCVKHILATE